MKPRTHCKRGHEYTDENTLYYRKTRACLACKKVSQRVSSRKQNEFMKQATADRMGVR